MSQTSDFNDNDNEGNDNSNAPGSQGTFPPGSFPGAASTQGTGPFSQGGFSQAPQSNPFSADLKGDFTSNFGTSTNAVSQIFKEGGFVGENRSRIILFAVFAVFFIGGIFLFLNNDDEYDDEELVAEEEMVEGDDKDKKEGEEKEGDDVAGADEAAKDEKKEGDVAEEKAAESLPSPVDNAAATAEAVPAASYMPPATNPPALTSPSDGAMRIYDETASDAEFTWSGSPGGWINFSRSSSMKPVDFRSRATGNSFTFRKPYPGTWYWQVKNGAGASEVRSFRIEAPQRRQVALSVPSEGGTLAGNGGTIAWSGDHKVAYYRVEISNNGWANPMYRFATSATQLQIQSVPAGPYQLRLGAFSEVAGRWEYSTPVNVTVQ